MQTQSQTTPGESKPATESKTPTSGGATRLQWEDLANFPDGHFEVRAIHRTSPKDSPKAP